MRALFRFLRPYSGVVTLAMVMLILSTAADLATPSLVQQIIDVGVAQKDEAFVWRVTILMVVVTLISTALSVGNSYFSVKASQSFAADLRRALFRKVQFFSFQNFDQLQTGGLLVRLTSDVNQVQSVVQLFLRLMTRAPLMMIGSFVLLVLVSKQLSLMILVLLPFSLALITLFTTRSNPLYLRVQRRLDNLNAVMQENLAGVRVVKAFVRARHEINRFSAANEHLAQETSHVMQILSLLNPLLGLAVNLATLAALWFGGVDIHQGTVTVGAVVAFVNYLMMINFPLNMLGTFAAQLTAAEASATRINEVFDAQAAVQNKPDARKLEEVHGRVTFENVSFSYNGKAEEAVLRGISFEADPGEKIAILGATGAGKSTLVTLIPRYYDPSGGRVLLDGVDVRDLELSWLRSQVGISMQDPILFSGTIRENIAYGRPTASLDEVIAAAQAAQADEFIRTLPAGYDTQLGQRGVNVSGGQKQRLAIARALLIKPKILILDDSTSAVDVETESLIESALDAGLVGCTRFVIAQRISSVLHADRIILLERGEISAIGTHHQLMTASSLYREIYTSQLGARPSLGGATPPTLGNQLLPGGAL